MPKNTPNSFSAGALYGRLFGRLELQVYPIILPYYLIYVYVMAEFRGPFLNDFLWSVGVGVGVTILVGIAWRALRVRTLAAQLQQAGAAGADPNLAREVKLRLLRYPLAECLDVAVRWFLGPGAGCLYMASVSDASPRQLGFYFVGLAFALPATLVLFYFQTERALRTVFEAPWLRSVELDQASILRFGFRPRLVATLLATANLPVFVLASMLLCMHYGWVKIPDLPTVLTVFGLLAVPPLLVTARSFSASSSAALESGLRTATAIRSGLLTHRIAAASADEFGLLEQHLGGMTRSLRTMIGTIRAAADRLTEDAGQLNERSLGLSASSTDQASGLEQVAAAIEQANATASVISRTAHQQTTGNERCLAALADLESSISLVSQVAADATAQARKTEAGAQEGDSRLKRALDRLDELAHSTDTVLDQVRQISEIADQVSLLALNASIEAARAGEAGRGFSVVAEQVSKLAERTQSYVNTISESIGVSRDDMRNGIEAARGTYAFIMELSQNIRRTAEGTAKIEHQAREQEDKSRQVTRLIRDVVEQSAQIVGSVHEQARAFQEISANTDAISGSANRVLDASRSTADLAARLLENGETLSDAVGQFRTPDEGPIHPHGKG